MTSFTWKSEEIVRKNDWRKPCILKETWDQAIIAISIFSWDRSMLTLIWSVIGINIIKYSAHFTFKKPPLGRLFPLKEKGFTKNPLFRKWEQKILKNKNSLKTVTPYLRLVLTIENVTWRSKSTNQNGYFTSLRFSLNLNIITWR